MQTVLFNLISLGVLLALCGLLSDSLRTAAMLACPAAILLWLTGLTRWFWLEMCAAFAEPDHDFNEKGAGRYLGRF